MRHEENHMCRHVCRHRTTCAWALVLGLAALIWQAPRAPSPWTFPHLGGRLLVPPPTHRQLGGLRDELGKKGVVVDIDLLQDAPGSCKRWARRTREVLGAGRVYPQRRYAEAGPVAGRVPARPGHEQLRAKRQ